MRDRNLPMCTRCRQYGYCCDEEGESNVMCQKQHWRNRGHMKECAALVTAFTTTTTTTTAAAVEDVARARVEEEGRGGGSAGEGDDADCGAVVGTCAGGQVNNQKAGGDMIESLC